MADDWINNMKKRKRDIAAMLLICLAKSRGIIELGVLPA
jgi:hypothetical protein